MKRFRLPPAAPHSALCDLWPQLGEAELLNHGNNCYSYAVGTIGSLLDVHNRAHAKAAPQPGDASGIPKNILLLIQKRSLQFWATLAQRDGLKPFALAPQDALPQPRSNTARLVTLTFDTETQDYHWLRQEQNGLWSHKPNSTHAPTWYDSERQPITDPRRAHLGGHYPQFIFFTVPQAGIDVCMPAPWRHIISGLVSHITEATEADFCLSLKALSQKIAPAEPRLSAYCAALAAAQNRGALQRFARALEAGSLLNLDDFTP